jgi:hypothetical protein
MGPGMTRRYSPPLTGVELRDDRRAAMRAADRGRPYWTLRMVLASDQCFSNP